VLYIYSNLCYVYVLAELKWSWNP